MYYFKKTIRIQQEVLKDMGDDDFKLLFARKNKLFE
mgnify:CR=1 FL=1